METCEMDMRIWSSVCISNISDSSILYCNTAVKKGLLVKNLGTMQRLFTGNTHTFPLQNGWTTVMDHWRVLSGTKRSSTMTLFQKPIIALLSFSRFFPNPAINFVKLRMLRWLWKNLEYFWEQCYEFDPTRSTEEMHTPGGNRKKYKKHQETRNRCASLLLFTAKTEAIEINRPNVTHTVHDPNCKMWKGLSFDQMLFLWAVIYTSREVLYAWKTYVLWNSWQHLAWLFQMSLLVEQRTIGLHWTVLSRAAEMFIHAYKEESNIWIIRNIRKYKEICTVQT